MHSFLISLALRNFSILFTEDQIWIIYDIALGSRRIGYCRILNMIIVKKALAAVISLPSDTNTKNVKETIIGGHNQ